MLRSLPAGLLVLLLTVASLGATAPSPSEVPAAARTTIELLAAGLTGTDGSVTEAGLGQVRLVATRDGTPFAGLDLVGAAVAGEEVAAWSATAEGRAERSGELSPDLAAEGVAAALHLGDYLVRARGTDATSSVSAVEGELDLAPFALRIDNVGPALSTSVTDASTSTTSLTVGAIELTLGDLLPAGLVGELPLGLVIDLLQQLPVTVPTAADLITQLEVLLDSLADLADADAAVEGARTELNDLVGDAPGIAAAEDAVAAAESGLAEATAGLEAALADREAVSMELAEAEAALDDELAAVAGEQNALLDALDDAEAAEAAAQAAVTSAEAALTAAEQDLAAAQSDLAGAQSDRTSAQGTVDELESDLTNVENEIATLETELAGLDLTDPVDRLRADEIEGELDALEDAQQSLEADLAAAASDLTDATSAVTAATTAVSDAEDAVTAAETALSGAEDDLADAEQAVADAEQALADASPAIAGAQVTLETAEDALTDADQVVADARAAVDAAETSLADANTELDALVDEAAAALGGDATALREELTRLRGEVQDLLDRVSTLIAGLPDLDALLDELRNGLAEVPVVSLGGISFHIHLHAGPDGATAEVDCTIDVASVFGQTLSAPTCSAASQLLAEVPGEVLVLLDALPIDELPLPRISGLSVDSDATPTPEDGVTRATAAVTGLALEVPAVTLSGVSDGLTQRLDGLLGEALAAARALSDTAAGATTAKRHAPANVLTDLDDLRAQVDDLELGAQLDGLATIGLDVTVGHVAAEVLHGATTDGPLGLASPFDAVAPGPGEGPQGAPDPDDGDGSGAPGAPGDEPPSLPATGGGVGLLSLVLLTGASLLGLRRR